MEGGSPFSPVRSCSELARIRAGFAYSQAKPQLFSAAQTDWRSERDSNHQYNSFRCKWLMFAKLTAYAAGQRIPATTRLPRSHTYQYGWARVQTANPCDGVAVSGHFLEPLQIRR